MLRDPISFLSPSTALSKSHTSSSSLYRNPYLCKRFTFMTRKKREVMISLIHFLLLKDTNWRAPLCGSHKEGRFSRGLQDIKRTTANGTAEHLKSNKTFIHSSAFYLWIQMCSSWLQAHSLLVKNAFQGFSIVHFILWISAKFSRALTNGIKLLLLTVLDWKSDIFLLLLAIN